MVSATETIGDTSALASSVFDREPTDREISGSLACDGFVSKVLATLPETVLGSCTIMMFGTIVISGIQMLLKCGFSDRNVTIASLSLSIGIGFTLVPNIFQNFPAIVQSIFAQNCVAVVFVVAIFLDLVMPRAKSDKKSNLAENSAEEAAGETADDEVTVEV